MSTVKDPLKRILMTYCDANEICLDDLRLNLNNGMRDGELFKQQLREAIDNQSITPEEYESLTGHDFDTQEELQEWLEEMWEEIN